MDCYYIHVVTCTFQITIALTIFLKCHLTWRNCIPCKPFFLKVGIWVNEACVVKAQASGPHDVWYLGRKYQHRPPWCLVFGEKIVKIGLERKKNSDLGALSEREIDRESKHLRRRYWSERENSCCQILMSKDPQVPRNGKKFIFIPAGRKADNRMLTSYFKRAEKSFRL